MSLLGRVQLASRASAALSTALAFGVTLRLRIGYAARIAVNSINPDWRTPMNKIIAFILLVISTSISAGCELVGDIFEAGVWLGVILVIMVIALLVWLFAKARS
jgi:uncharacterized membrane protein YkvI